MRGEQNIRRTSLLAIVQTVKFDDLECRPSDSPIWIADRQIRRFGMQTVQFNERRIRRFGIQTMKFDDFECRPSNSKIWNADHRIKRFGVVDRQTEAA